MQIMAGNFRAMEIHMNAVEKMVRLRGGLDKLGMESVLHMMVSWSAIPSPSPHSNLACAPLVLIT